MNRPVLQLDDVTKAYGGGSPITALHDISLSVTRGEFVAIVGPSGSGKTTLLQLMGTLDRPTAGTVRVDGIAVDHLSDAGVAAVRAARIGFVFQQFFLDESQSILDNVADGLLYLGVPFADRRAQAELALQKVGLSDRPKARPAELSGGQRQRVAIARAIVGRPSIVLADEPTGNLDRATGESITQLLEGLNRDGVTIVEVTHDPDIAARASRQVTVRDGRIISDSGPRDSHEPRDSPTSDLEATGYPRAARLAIAEYLRLSVAGLRTRRLRSFLSVLGISIGVAAIVAVLGLSSSAQAALLGEISALGTNLLVVQNGQTLAGQATELPGSAPGMIRRIAAVTHLQETGAVDGNVYRSPLIPAIDTDSLTIDASSVGLPGTVGAGLAEGSFLNAATAREPVCVLGAVAARRLGVDRVFSGQRIWLDNTWCYVAGILKPATLVPAIDTSVLVGFPAAEHYLGFDGHPTTIYVRTRGNDVNTVHDLLAATADPENPSDVEVSQPSAALQARADAEGAFNNLFLGLGAVALLVGAIGVANTMIISVLERRSEIGLRRALGATQPQIRIQFLSEAIVLGLIGGVIGVGSGFLATAIYASLKNEMIDMPPLAWVAGMGSAILIAAAAGLWPAIRASQMSPTAALWSV